MRRTRAGAALGALALTAAAVPAATAGPAGAAQTAAPVSPNAGNFVFIHPDGTDAAYFAATRIYWEGPDGVLEWDRLPEMSIYRGHMADQLVGTSNGGATTHAFGFKVDGPDSFGQDTGAADVLAGDFQDEGAREIVGLSGYPASWLREAGNAGYPIGVVNDGDAAEPGTAVFLSEVPARDLSGALESVRQFLQGRPGFDDADAQPEVVLNGGEALFLPEGTPYCTAEQLAGADPDGDGVATAPTDCVVHRGAGDTIGVPESELAPTGGLRTDGINLLAEAEADGYTVVRTRGEFDALSAAIEAGEVDAAEVKVLGLFADEDVFNDETEESLAARGLVDPSVDVDAKQTNLILYGSEPGTPGYDPPTPQEMAELALEVLQAHSDRVGLPYASVMEVEATDNFANNNNAVGSLLGAFNADQLIGVARDAIERDPETTVLTAADSTAGGMHVVGYNLDRPAPGTVGSIGSDNPALDDADGFSTPLDGRYGRFTEPFVSEPDQFGQEHPFAIGWVGTPDVGGGIVARAEGQYEEAMDRVHERFDNVDVYRLAYLSLFGRVLGYPEGYVSPTRADDAGPETARPPGLARPPVPTVQRPDRGTRPTP